MNKSEAAEILGVAEDATPEEIKRAYKGASFKYHPDHGGSTELFDRLQIAHKTLKGETHDQSDRGLDIFMSVFVTALGKLQDPEHENLVSLIKGTLTDKKTKLAEMAVATRSDAEGLRQVLSRVGHADLPNNPVTKYLKDAIAAAESHAVALVKEISNVDSAIRIAGQYSYKVEPRMAKPETWVKFNPTTWGYTK